MRTTTLRMSAAAASEKTMLLCSGGVESAVLVAQALAAGRQPVPLFADYSQRGAKREHQAAQAVCAAFENVPLQTLDLRAEGAKFQSINRLHIPMPHRNLVLLSLALSWASTHGCSQLAIGLNKDDFGKDAELAASDAPVRYTTGTRAFAQRFSELASVVAPEVEVALPQAELSKAEVIRLGARLGVPLELTYSCMRGREQHCGACMQCRARAEAFASAGVPDGAVYEPR